MPRQSVRVEIFHQSYTIVTEDDPRDVHEIAHDVDRLMTSIADRTSSGDSVRVAVLTCFHLADKLREAEKRLKLYESKSEHIGALREEALQDA